ncbi:MAG TPA: DUF1707 domain-containing protein [Streptosporangiaceae bacterium]|nr:DUF1707 domain-containing protein [Streptosporangiaceae bacterium]
MMGEVAPSEPENGSSPAASTAPSQLRASHEDRDAVIEILRVAAGDGRLTSEELDERLEIAFNARTYGELARLTADLPAGAAHAPVAAASTDVAPKDLVQIDCRSGNAVRDGRWVVPKRMELKVTSGNVKLDLTQAVIVHPVLDIYAEVRSGNLRIVTKPGVTVDSDDVKVRSGNIKVKSPWGPEVPVKLRISLAGKVGSGNIIVRPKRRRRTFWQWLTRQPLPVPRYAGEEITPDQRRRLTQAG